MFQFLDEFLPRIVELAESAPDRKTKIVACELLHSIVIVMIGKSAFQLSGQSQVSFNYWKEKRYKLDTHIYERFLEPICSHIS